MSWWGRADWQQPGSKGPGWVRLAGLQGVQPGRLGKNGGVRSEETEEAPRGSAGQGASLVPPRLLFSSTSPLFVPLPLGCQIWLTQSVVSLLRLARAWKPKPSALHQRLIPLHWGEEGEDQGPRRLSVRQSVRPGWEWRGSSQTSAFSLTPVCSSYPGLDVGGVWERP